MLKVGLDIGTGFVKCVSDYGSVRFPSVYVKRIHGHWTDKASEAVGTKAQLMLATRGATAISPISRGRPDPRYHRQVELLLQESISQVNRLAKAPVDADCKVRMVVGLPYHAYGCRDALARMVKKSINAEKCTMVAQASGTLVDLE